MKKGISVIILLISLSLLGCSTVGKPVIKGVENRWGEITNNYTEILTEIEVYNPNPFSIPIKDVLTEEKENTKGITASSNNKQNTSETVEVKTTILKRTKYDKNKVIKKLADLADKVNKLRADQYVVVLPTEKEDKSKSETAANPNEDQLPPGCYGEDFHPEFFCC